MPVNGRIVFWSDLEFKVQSEETATTDVGSPGTATYSHQGALLTEWAADAILLTDGILLEVTTTSSPAGYIARYTGPGAPFGYTVSGGTYETSLSMSVVFKDLKIYCNLYAKWRVVSDSIELYVNGVLETTFPGIDYSTDALGPAWLYLFGVPAKLSGSCNAGRDIVSLPSSYSYSQSITSVVTGGWRFKEDGDATWYDLPVTIPSFDSPTVSGCPHSVSLAGILDVVDTWNSSITFYSMSAGSRAFAETVTYDGLPCTTTVTCYDNAEPPNVVWTAECTGSTIAVPPSVDYDLVTTTEEFKGGTLTLVPDLEKSIERFNSDYGALWYRTEFPQTTKSTSKSCTDAGVTDSDTIVTEVHPSQSEILSNVQNSAHAIEDTFGYNSYAPCTAAHTWSNQKVYVPDYTGMIALLCDCLPTPPSPCAGSTATSYGYTPPDIPQNETESASIAFEFPSTVEEASAGYMSHEIDRARYINTWCNPHWSYFYWREDWEVDGAPVTWPLYWGVIGHQWMYHTSLPGGEQTRKRNHIVSCPLETSGLTLFLDAFTGGLPWIGVSRWQTDEIEPDASKVLDSDSEDAWDSPDASCTLSFGAKITVNAVGTGAGTVQVRLDLGSFTVEPYQYIHLAKEVLLDWVTTNIDEVRVKLVSVTGAEYLFENTPGDGFTTRNVQYDLPSEDDEKYAGTWAQNWGTTEVVDLGADLLPTGISASSMFDEERVYSLNMLQQQQGAYLLFEIDVTDRAVNVELEYPEFFMPTTARFQYWESRQTVAFLWDESGAIRYGQWLFFNGVSLQNPPAVMPLGYTSTIIDWLCFRRLVLQGVEYDGGTPDLTTEIGQLYDSYEGQAVAQVDKFGHAFILPKGVTP